MTASSVAVVGMAGRFPGAASVAELWTLLDQEREATRWLTDEELLAAGVAASTLRDPNYIRASLILPDMEMFDAGFFGFSPREAAILDPQHRHFLECAWAALEDAGHMPERFEGSIGVFAGCGMQAYLAQNLLSNPELLDTVGLFLLRHTGNDKDFLPTRLSYLLNLRGPSVAVQTACSTSLVAVHMACQSLITGCCDMALAGGVSIELPHRRGYRFMEGEILSPDGHCRAFDDDAKGTLFGSGVGVVVLRRLEDAIASGDNIHLVIRGSAINNDGAQKAGYLAPSVDGQAQAAAEALAMADVDPSSVSYIEAHGTGTAVGDPIELAALAQAYGTRDQGGPCGIGSIKTNIGHLDTAAGVASLIKVALAMRHRKIPASLNYRRPNTRFDLAASRFHVVARSQPWARSGQPRRAAVNSLGVGGTNAHVVVEEPPAPAPSQPAPDWQIMTLSARSEAALQRLRDKWRQFAADPPQDFTLANAAFTTQIGRRSFDHRCAVIARDIDGLRAALTERATRRASTGIKVANPRVVFMFPGGGAQYPGAGRELYERVPAFQAAVEQCFAAMPAEVPADLRRLMFECASDDGEAARSLEQPVRALSALFVLEYAFAAMWRQWGVSPHAVIGHSAGEYAAAVVAGVMSLEDALSVVALRGQIFERMEPGGMLSVQMPEARLRARLGPELDLAAVNDRELCVVSGPAAALAKLEAELKADGIECRRVRINVAAHSRLLDPHLDAFRSRVEAIGLSPPRLRFVSTLTAEPESTLLGSADYWVRHLRHTVRFAGGLDAILSEPDTILVEVGPGQSLSALARLAQGGRRPVAVLASCRQADDPDGDVAFALGAAGRLWASGQELDWDRIRPGGGRRISLPTYAFERERHWIEPGLKPATAETAGAAREISRLGRLDDWFMVPDWRPTPLPPAVADPARHCLVFGGHTRLSHALEKALAGRTVHVIHRGESFGRSADGAWCIDPANSDHYGRLLSELEHEGVRPDGIFYLWALEAEGSDPAQLFEPIFRLCQALQRHDAGTAMHLLAATSGTLAPQGERVAHPEGATLLGPCQAAAREIPLLQAQLVDLEDPVGAADIAAAQLVSEFDGRARDGLAAYRGNDRWTQEIVAAPQADSVEFPARLVREGVYVITGGLGGIGLELAQFLASEVDARLALIARREPDAEALQRLRQIEQAGAELLVVQADITDQEQTRRALQSVAQRFGGINGVFHAAGLLDDAPLAVKTLEDARRVMSAKVAGGAVLDALLPPGKIDLFAVFSSTSAIVGVPGQVDYIAANAYLDALAASRPDGLAIDWGVWRDVGMAAKRYRKPDPDLAARAALHPLLGAETARSETEICFEAVVKAADAWPIAEHLVAGRPVLPGMAYIEIARAAMATVRPDPVEIANLSLVAPLAFETAEPRRIRTTLTATPDGFDFTVRSQSLIDRDDWTTHAHAGIRAAAPIGAQCATSAILPADGFGPAIQRPEPAQADTVSFGPRWRNLSAQRLATNGGVAEIELAEPFADDLSIYSFHPAMADMAATFGLALVKATAGPGMVFLPMSVERVRLFAPLPRRFKSFCRLTRQIENSFVTFDVVFTGFDEEPIATLEGFTLRCAPAAVVATPSVRASGVRPAVQQILANGILAAEAPSLFRRVLASPHRRIVVSSIALADLRRVLAEETHATAPQRRSAPARSTEGVQYASDIEARVASYWSELLGVEQVAADDEFFALGGHSLAAVRLFARIRKQLGVDLPLASLYEARSLRQFCELVASKLDRPAPAGGAAEDGGSDGKARIEEWSPLVTVNRGSPSATPFFCVHGGGGNVLTFTHLASALGSDQPFYGLQAVGVDGLRRPLSTIEEMASMYLEGVRAVRPDGPYVLGGYSAGGVIAFEMGRQLIEAGEGVALLVLFDSVSPVLVNFGPARGRRWNAEYLLRRPARGLIRRIDRRLGHGTLHEDLDADEIERMRMLIRGHLERDEVIPEELRGIHLYDSYMKAQERYRPTPLPIPILLFRATQQEKRFTGERWLGWERLSTSAIELRSVSSDHLGLMSARNVARMSAVLRRHLGEVGRVRVDSVPGPPEAPMGTLPIIGSANG